MVNIRVLRLLLDSKSVKTEASGAKDALNRYGQGARKAGQESDKLRGKFKQLGDQSSKLKRTLIGVFGGLSLALAVRKTVGVISEFETQIVTLGGVSRATADELETLEEAARNLGATTRFSASEAAEAQINLARAGFEVNEILSATPAILDTASAAQLGLARSSEIASITAKQFGLEAKDIGGALNDFLVIANRTKSTVDSLATGMVDAGTIGAQFGNETQEVAAALGVLQDRGLEAGRSGVAYRQVLLALSNPSKGALKTFRELGVAYEDLNPEANKAIDIFERLGEANLTAGQAAQIFGTRQATGALILSQTSDQMRELIEDTKEYTSETEELARAQEATLSGSFKNLISIVQELQLQLGGATGGGLQSAVDTLTGALRFLAGVSDDVSTSSEIMAGIIGGALVVALVGATVAAKRLAIALIANPFVLLIGSIGAVIALLIKYRKELITVQGTTGTIGDFAISTWEAIKDSGDVLTKALSLGWVAVASAAETFWLELKDLALDTYDTIVLGALAAEQLIPEGFGGRRSDIINADIAQVVGGGVKRNRENDARQSDLLQDIIDAQSELDKAVEDAGPSILDRVSQRRNERLADQAVFIAEGIEVAKAAFMSLAGIGVPAQESLAEATDKVVDAIEEQVVLTSELTGEQQKAQQAIEDMFASLQFERDMIGLSNEERRLAIDLIHLEAAARAAGVEDIDALGESYKKLAKDVENANLAQELGNEVGQAFGQFARDAIDDFDNIGDAWESLVERLIAAAIEAAIIQPLIDAISGNAGGGAAGASGTAGLIASLFAKGGAFSRGQVVPMGSGQVFNSPTFLPMAGNRTALVGEAGTEVLMPAERMANGKLGVAASGGGGPAIGTLIIQAPDVKTGLSESKRQLARRAQRALRG